MEDLKIEYLSIDSLHPYEKNARKHTKEGVQTIVESIKAFGFRDPIGIWGKKNLVVEGHGRLMAAKELGMETVPCIRLDDLTDEQRRAYTLAHNQTTDNSSFDFDALNAELADLDALDLDFDMEDFGFDMSFLDEDHEVVEDDYDVVVPEEARTQPGDIYQLGRHRLICGDSTDLAVIDRLMDGVKADLVVTDPPYNMGYEGAGNTKDRSSKRILNDKMPEDKFEEFLGDVYTAYFLSMKDGASIYVFYKELGNGVFMRKMRDSGLTYKQELIWVKSQLVLGGSKYQSMYEPCLMGVKGKSIKKWNGKRNQKSVIETIDFMSEEELRNVIKELLTDADDIDVIREKKQLVNDLHPTMKPIRLLAKLIRNSSDKSDVVMDLFGGSGSTLIACEQLNRKCYMAELDPKYCDVIIDRWEKLTGEKAVLLNV